MSSNRQAIFDHPTRGFEADMATAARVGSAPMYFATEAGAPECWKFAPKEVIYLEGDRVSSLCQIHSGLVKLVSYLPNERSRIVRLCGQGDLLGLEGLLGQRYHHTAIAVNRVEIGCGKSHRLHLLEQEDPHRYCEILKRGFDQLANSDRWLADFSTGGIKSRIGRLLEFLSLLRFGEASTNVELLTVNDMADILGVTAESVSRILAEFKRRRILQPMADSPRERYRIDFPRLRQQTC